LKVEQKERTSLSCGLLSTFSALLFFWASADSTNRKKQPAPNRRGLFCLKPLSRSGVFRSAMETIRATLELFNFETFVTLQPRAASFSGNGGN
jgi:hypothetical protein